MIALSVIVRHEMRYRVPEEIGSSQALPVSFQKC
jgi:hypothetical protein